MLNSMDEHSNGIEITKRIDAYLKGNLSDDEAERLWVELLANPEYLEYLETEIALQSILQSRRSQEASITFFNKPWRWVAAAVLGGALLFALNFFQDSPSPETLALEHISMTESLESPQVMRSQTGSLSGADSLLNLGFQAALAGNIDSALAIYESIAVDFTADSILAQAYLNIGILRYNRQEFRASANAFEQTVSTNVDNTFLHEKAFWYLGNAYLQLERLPEARSAITRTLSFDGLYRMPASRLLQILNEMPGS